MGRLIGFWLIIGIAGAFALYSIARARGARNPGLWAFIGAIAGPLVVFLILWSQKKQVYKREDERG